MWALVLLEQASGDLIYCRDRLGVKPLYLHHDGRQLVLASEIRAIAASLGATRHPIPPRCSISWLPVSPTTPATPLRRHPRGSSRLAVPGVASRP